MSRTPAANPCIPRSVTTKNSLEPCTIHSRVDELAGDLQLSTFPASTTTSNCGLGCNLEPRAIPSCISFVYFNTGSIDARTRQCTHLLLELQAAALACTRLSSQVFKAYPTCASRTNDSRRSNAVLEDSFDHVSLLEWQPELQLASTIQSPWPLLKPSSHQPPNREGPLSMRPQRLEVPPRPRPIPIYTSPSHHMDLDHHRST